MINVMKSRVKIGEELAIAYYSDFMEHPEWRGESFSWETFPAMVARLAKVQVASMCFPYTEKSLDLIYDIVFKKTTELVNKGNNEDTCSG